MQINFESFDKLTMGDADFAQDLLRIYIDEFEEYISEVEEFLTHKDLSKFRQNNHDLRTLVKTLSLDSIIDLQEKLKSSVTRNLPADQLDFHGKEMKKIIQQVIKALKDKLG
jgi:HPt (histidine-containing phosphotransfer) domain-containing protein